MRRKQGRVALPTHDVATCMYACDLCRLQIDLFGEISGISFTPAGDCLYVGIADITYASLLAFSRVRDGARFRPTPAATYAGVAAQPTPPQPRFGVVAS